MQEYIFLFGLAFVWILFAVVQDLRTREISNWLNFSLIAFALAYRAFYSIVTENWRFLFYGIFGIVLFVILGYALYYSRVFAGGDAKLLFGLGAILPFESLRDYLFLGGGFIFILFLTGVVYSLFFTWFLVYKKKNEFFRDFSLRFKKGRKLFYVSMVVSGLLVTFYYNILGSYSLVFLAFVFLPLMLFYVKSVEKVCMIKLVDAHKLTEGDWLEKDIKVGSKLIRKSVHGLSLEEIRILRKAKKKVWVKDGVPFSPAFLFALVLFIYFWFRIFY